MAKDRDPNELYELAFPFGGIDSSASYDNQRKNTSPAVQNARPWNCRSFRRQGSRRPGTSKYCSVRLNSAAGQDLNYLIVNQDQTVPTGTLMSAGATIASIAVYEPVAGGSAAADLALAGTQSLGCIDNDLNFYTAAVTTGGASISLKQYTKAGVLVWTVTMTVTGTGSGAKLWGLGAISGVVYVWVIDASMTGIYRFSTDDGSRLDPNAWIDTNGGLVSATLTAVRAYNCLAIGGSMIGVVGGLAGALVCQGINTNGAIAFSTTLQPTFQSYPARIVADQGGNFYILDNAAGGGGLVNHLYKITWGGEFPTAFNSGVRVTSTGNAATDIAYEPTTYALCVVGATIFANASGATADDSYQQWAAVEGTLAARAKPGGFNWLSVCADGLGSVRLRRSASAANNLTSITANGVTSNWLIDTGAPTSSEFLWVQCTGNNISPLPSSMRPTRVTRLMGVAGGALYRFTRTAKTTIDATFVDGAAPVVYSTVLSDVLYYVDGSSYRTYNGLTDTAGTLTASDGTLPASTNGSKCRLNMTHNGRLYMSGLRGDDQNWFASKQFDATNWQYVVSPSLATQAVAGNNAPCGKCPDKVNALISWRDDLAWFGGDHSIWQLTGDPADGGRFDLISADTGIAFGRAFCFDPAGTLYLLGNQGVVYRASRGNKPQAISGAVNLEIYRINVGTNIISMAWDQKFDGFHMFVAPIDPTATTTHYWWDAGTEVFSPKPATAFTPSGGAYSWWPDVFGNVAHNAAAILLYDGDDPDDRVLLMFGRDGYVRQFDNTAEDDDGTAIDSFALIGPVSNPKRYPYTTKDLQMTLEQNSGALSWGWQRGESVQAAVNNTTAAQTGTFAAGRNHSRSFRWTQHVGFLKLYSSATDVPWCVERGDLVLETHGSLAAQRIFYPSTAPEDEDIPAPTPEPDPGTAYTPALQVPNFRLWTYGNDAALSGLSDGDPLPTWVNRGAAEGTVEDVGAGFNPTIQAAELNGLAVARFDGSNDLLGGTKPVSEYWSASALTGFLMCKGASDTADVDKTFLGDTSGYLSVFQRSNGNVGAAAWDGGLRLAESAGALNTWQLITVKLESGVLSISVNTGTPGTIACGNLQNTTGVCYYGRSSFNHFLSCDIAEVIFTNVALSAYDIALVQGYLSWKWSGSGLYLATGHAWKNEAPTTGA